MDKQHFVNHSANSQWAFQSKMQNVILLPSIHTVLASRNPQNLYTLNLKTQAQIQREQIDSAIQLLKTQYDAIMSSVEKSNNLSLEDGGAHAQSCRPESSDQRSFAAQFELPGAELVGVQVGSGTAADTVLRSNSLCKKRNLQAMQSLEDPHATPGVKSIDSSEAEISERKKILKHASHANKQPREP